MPRLRTVGELRGEVAYKKSWKAPGYVSECFNPLPVLKPAFIEPWDRYKMSMPERSYEKFALCKTPKSNPD